MTMRPSTILGSLLRRWRARFIAGCISGVALAAAPAAAQSTCTTANANNSSCNVSPQISFSLTVPRVVQLTLSASTLSLINGDALAEDYEAGFKTAGSLTATAWADTGAVVTMAAATTDFTAPAGVTKPASTLQASLDGGTTWTGLTTGGATVITIGAGGQGNGAGGGLSQVINFRTLLGYATDPPGSYSLTIHFTVTAP